MKVLVKEKIADTGVELLQERFDVDLGLEMSDEELRESIGAYDAILIRSATKMTPELIELATNLKVIGRAGTGVDNVDIPAATRRGIIVANAPESNSVAAAEHTLALALALFRNVPQAHESLVAGRWDRSKFKGAELYGKTLGVVGFGRIGQLVAKRAQGFEMDVVAFDKFVSAERFRELGVEGAESIEDLFGRGILRRLLHRTGRAAAQHARNVVDDLVVRLALHELEVIVVLLARGSALRLLLRARLVLRDDPTDGGKYLLHCRLRSPLCTAHD